MTEGQMMAAASGMDVTLETNSPVSRLENEHVKMFNSGAWDLGKKG